MSELVVGNYKINFDSYSSDESLNNNKNNKGEFMDNITSELKHSFNKLEIKEHKPRKSKSFSPQKSPMTFKLDPKRRNSTTNIDSKKSY